MNELTLRRLLMDAKTKALLFRAPEIVAALRHCPVVECAHCAFAGEECKLGEQAATLIEAYAVEDAQLREQLDESLGGHMATEANEPLTLEDLRGMDGEPVWIEYHGKPKWNEWRLVKWDHQMNAIRLWDNTGMWWRYDPEKMDVYLCSPEGGEG